MRHDGRLRMLEMLQEFVERMLHGTVPKGHMGNIQNYPSVYHDDPDDQSYFITPLGVAYHCICKHTKSGRFEYGDDITSPGFSSMLRKIDFKFKDHNDNTYQPVGIDYTILERIYGLPHELCDEIFTPQDDIVEWFEYANMWLIQAINQNPNKELVTFRDIFL